MRKVLIAVLVFALLALLTEEVSNNSVVSVAVAYEGIDLSVYFSADELNGEPVDLSRYVSADNLDTKEVNLEEMLADVLNRKSKANGAKKAKEVRPLKESEDVREKADVSVKSADVSSASLASEKKCNSSDNQVLVKKDTGSKLKEEIVDVRIFFSRKDGLSEKIIAKLIREFERYYKKNSVPRAITNAELWLTARLAFKEAGGEGTLGLAAVIAVVKNRAEKYGMSVESVITKEGQFASISKVKPDKVRHILPIVRAVFSGWDPTKCNALKNGATHFYAPKLISAYQLQFRVGVPSLKINNQVFHDTMKHINVSKPKPRQKKQAVQSAPKSQKPQAKKGSEKPAPKKNTQQKSKPRRRGK